MELMENSLGSVELSDRDEPSKYLVAQAIAELNSHLEQLGENKASIFIPVIKSCLSDYCTLQEMKTLIVEKFFTTLFAENKVRRDVYGMGSDFYATMRKNVADTEAKAKEVVAAAVKSLEVALDSKTLTNETIREGMKKMIICLSNFYTLEKTLEYMTSSTGLTAKQVELLFNLHIGNDEAKRETYLKRARMSVSIHQLAAKMRKDVNPVAEIIKGLERYLKAFPNQKTQVIFQSLKTCLSQYYPLEEMKREMSARVEQYYTSIFVDDELGHQAYLEESLPREAARRHAEEAASKSQETIHGSSSSNLDLQMELMENSLGSFELLDQADEEAVAKKLVSSLVSELEDSIKATDDQGSRNLFKCMVTCLSNYYTMEEMKRYMSSRTILNAQSVETVYTKLFQRDVVAHRAYVAVSKRMEAIRATQNQSSDSQGSTESPTEASTSYSAGNSTRTGSNKNFNRPRRN